MSRRGGGGAVELFDPHRAKFLHSTYKGWHRCRCGLLDLQSDGIEERGRLAVSPIKLVPLGLIAGQSHPCGERFRERLIWICPRVVTDGLGRPFLPEHFVKGMSQLVDDCFRSTWPKRQHDGGPARVF